MLSFSIIPTPAELKQAAAIERRRQNEEIRRCRIFDPKARKMGVDIQALEEQVKEKKRLAEEEKRLEQAYFEQKQREGQLLQLLDRQTKLEKQKIANEIKKYRICKQKFEDRREFDLNDPNYVKNATACQRDEDDPHLGIASMQKFEGEDLCKPERLKLQAEQKRAWYIQQIREKKRAEEERRRAEEEYQKAMIARDQRTTELEKLERECRLRLDAAEKEFNRAMAEQIKSRRKIEEMQDLEDVQAHLFNVMTSDMLTESSECAISSLGPGRVIPTMFRGLTEVQKAQYRREQQQQAQSRRVQIEQEKQKEAEWDALANELARVVDLKDMELQRKKTLFQAKITEENKILEETQREQRKKLEADACSFPTCEYFDQFGTSTR